MLAARLRPLPRAGAPAKALATSLRSSITRPAFSTTSSVRKPAVEDQEDGTLPIGYGTRIPLAIQALYSEPLRRKATHNLPVCDLQLRSYSVRNLEFMCDFAMRAAYYCNLPAFGPVPLPKKTERWTVPRSNFVHKKSQENFERVTHKRLIQIKDGNPETVELWLAFLRKHQFHGVGFKANVFNWEPLGGSPIKLGSLRDTAKKAKFGVSFGPTMDANTMKEVERILGTKEYQKLMEEYAEQPPTEDPAEEAAAREEILRELRGEPEEVDLSEHHGRLDTIASEIHDSRVQVAEYRAEKIAKQIENAQGYVVSARINHLEEQIKNAQGHVAAARVDRLEQQITNTRGNVLSARLDQLTQDISRSAGDIVHARVDRLSQEIANAFEHVSAAREAMSNPVEEEPLVDAQKQAQEEIAAAQPEELVEIARQAAEQSAQKAPKAPEPEVKKAEEKSGQVWPTVKKDS